jgi:hypothetical protein
MLTFENTKLPGGFIFKPCGLSKRRRRHPRGNEVAFGASISNSTSVLMMQK